MPVGLKEGYCWAVSGFPKGSLGRAFKNTSPKSEFIVIPSLETPHSAIYRYLRTHAGTLDPKPIKEPIRPTCPVSWGTLGN